MTQRLTIKKFMILFFGVLVLCYFVYHLIEGNRGIRAYFQLQKNIDTEMSTLDKLMEQRVYLEQQNKLVGDKSLDLDKLDELSRKNLGVAKPEEIIIPHPQ